MSYLMLFAQSPETIDSNRIRSLLVVKDNSNFHFSKPEARFLKKQSYGISAVSRIQSPGMTLQWLMAISDWPMFTTWKFSRIIAQMKILSTLLRDYP